MNFGERNEMPGMVRPAGFGIRSKMLLGFGTVFLLLLAGFNAIYLFGLPHSSIVGEFRLNRIEAEHRLTTIADIQKNWIEAWRFEREADTLGLARNPDIKAALSAWTARLHAANSNTVLTTERIQAQRNHFTSATLMAQIRPWIGPGTIYQSLQIVDAASGLVIASTEPSRLGSNVSKTACVQNALQFPGDSILELHTDTLLTNPVLHISRAIVEAGKPTAILILETRLESILAPLHNPLVLQGLTGRSLLMNAQGLILNPDKTSTSALKSLPVFNRSEPARLAVQHQEGILETTDHRGRAILAAYRSLQVSPGHYWGLVVQQDMSELNAQTHRAALSMAFLWLVLLSAALATALFVARRLSRPLRELDRAAFEVNKGNLNARATVYEPDEAGRLATTFNAMVQHIQQSQLDLEQKVRNRTSELDAVNHTLTLEIAERRATEERLHQFSRAVEQSPCSIVITNTKGEIEYVNPKFTEVTGYTAEEVRGQNPRLLKSGANPPEIYRDLWAALIEGTEWKGEFHNRKKNGELYWEFASISPIRNAEGVVTHYLAIKEDITQRKAIEAEREHLIVELQEAIARVKTLSGLLPICASCKKIRDDGGYWNTVELYVQQHSAATFTHGICPDCARRLYPELYTPEAQAANITPSEPSGRVGGTPS